MGNRRQGAGINMYINNNLGFIFLGDMGGTWGCRYQSAHKQPFRVYLFRGHRGGTWGGLGDKETGCRYQQVHKQPFSVYLFRGHGGDLGIGERE